MKKLKKKHKKEKSEVILNPKTNDKFDTKGFYEQNELTEKQVKSFATKKVDLSKPKKSKFYNVTVKVKDKSTASGISAVNTMLIRAGSETSAYKFAKTYYKNSRTNKVRLNRRKNRAIGIKEGFWGALAGALVHKKNSRNTHSILGGLINKKEHRHAAASDHGEEHHVVDSKGKTHSIHNSFKTAKAHADKNGHTVVTHKTHEDSYYIVHKTKGHITDRAGNPIHKYDSLTKARNAMKKHKLNPNDHVIGYHRAKIK